MSKVAPLGKSRRSMAVVALTVVLALIVSGVYSWSADSAWAASGSPNVTVTRAATGKLVMKKGSSYKLAAKASAGKLTYKSSKPKVVSVTKKGVLKAKKTGKATVTVTAKNGAKKAVKKVKVTVVKTSKFKKVKKVSAKASAGSLTVGQTARVSVSFKPANASNKNVVYASSNSAVLSVDAYGKVTAKAAGSARVTVTSCDNAKAKAWVAFSVTAKPGGRTSPTVTRAQFAADLCSALGLDTVADAEVSPLQGYCEKLPVGRDPGALVGGRVRR